MLVPNIQLKYSWVYDMNCKQWAKNAGDSIDTYPSYKKIESYISIVEPLWKKIETDICKTLSDITGLIWHDAVIPCYVVGSIVPFSDPLTLPVYLDDPQYFVDTLVHELIHQLFTQGDNLERSATAWEYIDTIYAEESEITRIHIPLHAIHAHIYHTYFSVDRMQNDKNWVSSLPDYTRSWEIVGQDGYANICTEFSKRIKNKLSTM